MTSPLRQCEASNARIKSDIENGLENVAGNLERKIIPTRRRNDKASASDSHDFSCGEKTFCARSYCSISLETQPRLRLRTCSQFNGGEINLRSAVQQSRNMLPAPRKNLIYKKPKR